MLSKVKSSLPAIVVAVLLGLVLGGGAVAAYSVPDHSVGWNKLTPAVQKRIHGKPRPAGPKRIVRLRCGLVKGECLIYSDEFWRLHAAREPFESDTGVYPEPPFCMKAVSDGEPLACLQAISYLYPDGSLGKHPGCSIPQPRMDDACFEARPALAGPRSFLTGPAATR